MLYSIIVALALGLLSIFPPYVGFLYSGKIIKEFKEKGLKKGLIILGVSGSLIAIVFNILPVVLMFFGVYGTIILMYFIFQKIKLSNWDKAFITTLIATALVVLVFYGNKEFFITLKDSTVKEVLATMIKIDKTITEPMIMASIDEVLSNLLNYSVVFIFISSLLTYVVVDRQNWEKWEFSYVYLLGYIISFLLIKFGKDSTNFTRNLMEIFKTLYIIYGVKEFYVIVKNKSKLKFFSIGLTMLIYSIEPFILFVYGAIKSFKLKKEEETNV